MVQKLIVYCLLVTSVNIFATEKIKLPSQKQIAKSILALNKISKKKNKKINTKNLRAFIFRRFQAPGASTRPPIGSVFRRFRT